MALKIEEIPVLLFWVAVLGITVFVASKAVKQVGEEVSKVFS